jgi:hypothetical protein
VLAIVDAIAMRHAVLGLVLAAAVIGVSAGRAMTGDPVLRAASATHGHVVVSFTLGDLRPGVIEVATSSSTLRSGGFVPGNVRLEESVTQVPDPATGAVVWRTHKRLAAGTYFVAVSAVATDGVTDCGPLRGNCLVRWSNVRRVVVR